MRTPGLEKIFKFFLTFDKNQGRRKHACPGLGISVATNKFQKNLEAVVGLHQ